MKLVWLQQAQNDLDAIADYIARHNPQAAWNIYQTIRNKIQLLSVQPGIGRPGRVRETRELVITGTPYIVAYTLRPLLDSIIILRVLHGAQLWPSEFDVN